MPIKQEVLSQLQGASAEWGTVRRGRAAGFTWSALKSMQGTDGRPAPRSVEFRVAALLFKSASEIRSSRRSLKPLIKSVLSQGMISKLLSVSMLQLLSF